MTNMSAGIKARVDKVNRIILLWIGILCLIKNQVAAIQKIKPVEIFVIEIIKMEIVRVRLNDNWCLNWTLAENKFSFSNIFILRSENTIDTKKDWLIIKHTSGMTRRIWIMSKMHPVNREMVRLQLKCLPIQRINLTYKNINSEINTWG